ncbi:MULTISPECIES: GNAT family N-acetyltransferase [Thalassotalea]|uniref:GNAT family N-acetyltransferase n=1 Tax=Thalassotalea castellviae TaxID=3075612 RepID=A0ABU3A3G1_9GAMM|nr:GNAT family N-acetyltransferase [Thalassotalea sp. W431]MDT0604484.1 GNAT family N-acetyltransferase [Thalassotalea sp. W431]
MKSTISFKKASQLDKPFLLVLRKTSMTAHLEKAGLVMNDQQHFQRIDEFFTDSHIICKDNEQIGLVKFALLEDRLHIRQFQILPAFHNCGIGTRVLSLLKKKAQERNLAITLNVLLANPALKLYKRQGFIIENETQLEYQMRWQPSADKSY